MDIIVKIDIENEDLKSKLPIDRVITINDDGITYLCDTQFTITKDMIEKVINDK